ncbi:aldolase/citrate lyase family protein [Agriterribacter sp.]|uniref:aldolase/citrate lyase family protein n=1 Tax=Agriterribacter sp. TaxID=2821509 RepID=UPI002BA76F39|nr:aldolase/citrate lyase family protein [Agriterribacter sp.]HTN07717.1 aldolase/citrate lyase family protein [Agriterribacter sp.]
MKTKAIQSFRDKLGNNECVYGLWVTLESASITEIAVACGMDWVVVDAEHGHLDWQDIMQHIRAAVRSNTVVLVRISHLDEALIKRALDIGADGIVIPHIETAAELQRALSFAKYAPAGSRAIGAERATAWGACFADHVKEANDNVLIVPIIESVSGGNNIREMLEVAGTNIFFFGPADYSASAGYAGQWEGPGVAAQINTVKNAVVQAGKSCGIIASGMDDILNRTKEGFRMIGLGTDGGLILKTLNNFLTKLGRESNIKPDLSVTDIKPVEQYVLPDNIPQSDRLETICKTGEGDKIELGPGIICEALTGAHNNAVALFTAIVTFDKGYTVLPAHTHPHSESITLISGSVCIEVENRRYFLQPLDNITIPKGQAHCVKNMSVEEKAVLHIAMPVDLPQRDLAEMPATEFENIPDDFCGHAGPERITRYNFARRYSAGPNTEFIDFFNDSMMPGIGMSGGFGLFYEGGRLPAHFHDFDESICITSGKATCFVEGREYIMSDLATALQPRGRIHYFTNQFPQSMSMIWVYAGAMPVRVEVPDEYALPE